MPKNNDAIVIRSLVTDADETEDWPAPAYTFYRYIDNWDEKLHQLAENENLATNTHGSFLLVDQLRNFLSKNKEAINIPTITGTRIFSQARLQNAIQEKCSISRHLLPYKQHPAQWA